MFDLRDDGPTATVSQHAPAPPPAAKPTATKPQRPLPNNTIGLVALLAGPLIISLTIAYTWHLVEGSKAADGLHRWLPGDWRRSPLFLGWAVSVMAGATTVSSTASVYCWGLPPVPPGADQDPRRLQQKRRRLLLAVWAAKIVLLTCLVLVIATDWLTHRTPYFFGVGGVTIAALFIVTAYQWVATPPPPPPPASATQYTTSTEAAAGAGTSSSVQSGWRTLGDVLILEGYALFVCAAWFTCGLHTVPAYILDPRWQRAGAEDATALAHVVMVLWCAAWACTAAGHVVKRTEADTAVRGTAVTGGIPGGKRHDD